MKTLRMLTLALTLVGSVANAMENAEVASEATNAAQVVKSLNEVLAEVASHYTNDAAKFATQEELYYFLQPKATEITTAIATAEASGLSQEAKDQAITAIQQIIDGNNTTYPSLYKLVQLYYTTDTNANKVWFANIVFEQIQKRIAAIKVIPVETQANLVEDEYEDEYNERIFLEHIATGIDKTKAIVQFVYNNKYAFMLATTLGFIAYDAYGKFALTLKGLAFFANLAKNRGYFNTAVEQVVYPVCTNATQALEVAKANMIGITLPNGTEIFKAIAPLVAPSVVTEVAPSVVTEVVTEVAKAPSTLSALSEMIGFGFGFNS